MKLFDKCEQFAKVAIFNTSEATVHHVMDAFGLEFKTGKISADVHKAIKKGVKKGCGSTEDEIFQVGAQLVKIFKVAK